MALFLFSCGTKKRSSSESSNRLTIEKNIAALEKADIPIAADSGLKYNDSLFYKGVYYNNVGSYDSAIIQLVTFSKLHPDISATYFQIARAYIGKNASIETIFKYINKSVELDPKNKWYLMYYADIIALRGEYLQAADIYADLIDNGNYDNEIFLKAFLNYERAEAYDSLFSIVEKMDKYTSIEDEYIDKLNVLIYTLKKDETDLEMYLLKKIESKENVLENQKQLLLFYIESKQSEKKDKLFEDLDFYSLDQEAQLEILQTLIIKYDSTTVIPVLQEIYFTKKTKELIETAEESIIQAWAFSPRTIQPYIRKMKEWAELPELTHEIPQFLSAYYFSAKHIDSTVYYSRLAFEKGLMDITNYSILFYTLLETQKTDEIKEIASTALQRDTNFTIAHFSLGLTYLLEQEHSSAYQHLLDALNSYDSSLYSSSFLSEIYMNLGDAYQHIENYDKNIVAEYYDSSLRYNPDSELILNNYAYFLSTVDFRLDDADSMSLKTLDTQPNNPYYLDTYGWILYKKGNYTEAKQYILKAIENSPQPSAVLWEHLGDIEIKLDNIEKAIKYYKIALDLKGDDETLLRKIAEYEK